MPKTKSKRFTKKDVGVYADSAHGHEGMLKKILDIAISEGMPEPTEEDVEEFSDDVWSEAEEWLNEHLAQEGYFFGSLDTGDWGYFPIEDE